MSGTRLVGLDDSIVARSMSLPAHDDSYAIIMTIKGVGSYFPANFVIRPGFHIAEGNQTIVPGAHASHRPIRLNPPFSINDLSHTLNIRNLRPIDRVRKRPGLIAGIVDGYSALCLASLGVSSSKFHNILAGHQSSMVNFHIEITRIDQTRIAGSES